MSGGSGTAGMLDSWPFEHSIDGSDNLICVPAKQRVEGKEVFAPNSASLGQ